MRSDLTPRPQEPSCTDQGRIESSAYLRPPGRTALSVPHSDVGLRGKCASRYARTEYDVGDPITMGRRLLLTAPGRVLGPQRRPIQDPSSSTIALRRPPRAPPLIAEDPFKLKIAYIPPRPSFEYPRHGLMRPTVREAGPFEKAHCPLDFWNSIFSAPESSSAKRRASTQPCFR